MHLRRVSVLVGLMTFGMALSGCLAFKAAHATGELAANTVIVAGKTGTAAVKATGRVATGAINSGGALTATGIESLAALAQAGMVTFVDVATGAIVRVPWSEGLSLHAAGAAAEVAVVDRAIDLVRNGRLVYSASRQLSRDPRLEPGDVVRLAGRVARQP
jgi:hypothetical protein